MVGQMIYIRTTFVVATWIISSNMHAATIEENAATHHEVGVAGELTSGDT